MSQETDYQSKLETITAIPESDLKSPVMPVDVFLQEAENLYHWARDDEADLTGVGLDWGWVTDLPVRAGALREAESIWFKKRFSQQETVKNWVASSEAGYALRDRMLHSFRYAYRKDPGLLARVSQITDGTGHADMIQDLNDIAVLGRGHIEPLLAINLDPAMLEEAAAASDHLSDLLARANVDREQATRTRIVRDQAYTHLKEAVDEVRDCGQYVFIGNEARLKGYISQYHKKANAKARRGTSSPPEPEAVS